LKEAQFIERRKEYRLPYGEKVIFTDGAKSGTAYGVNISRGGVFVTTLEPYPIDTTVNLAFCLPSLTSSFCVKGKVAHIVFDRQRCEVECGMGFMFLELNEQQKSTLNLHILNEQSTYLELKKLLLKERPNPTEIARCLKRLPALEGYDLLRLRYRVNRICTIFEPSPSLFEERGKVKASA
jgi:Tfp pilus assembly protein PilZ